MFKRVLNKLFDTICKILISVVLILILMLFQTATLKAAHTISDFSSGNITLNTNNNDYYKNNAPLIKAPSAILLELERGQILFSKQADKELNISTASKIMTAVLVIEKGNLDAKVTISKESSILEGSVLFLTIGEKYAVEDLLNAIIITNANDAANALAEYIGGDIEKFVEIMNDRASELNMKNTTFSNPTGLYDKNQYTTANDIAILMKHALSLPAFNRIFSYRAVPWVDKKGITVLTNSNSLFWSYDGVDGGKIGYSKKELQTAITSATKNSRRLIAIVLDAPDEHVLQDSVNLLNYGFESFKRNILVSKNQVLTSTAVGNIEINLISINDIYYTHPINETNVKSFSFNIAKDLTPPINKNMIMGVAHYSLHDGTIIDINLYPEEEILLPDSFRTTLIKRLKENRDIFVLLVILICIEALIIIYKIIKGGNYLIKKLVEHKIKEGSQEGP
jgi:D-alanyl-D-alanine carboxypeptidase (penicillin-binding protein 5/6)